MDGDVWLRRSEADQPLGQVPASGKFVHRGVEVALADGGVVLLRSQKRGFAQQLLHVSRADSIRALHDVAKIDAGQLQASRVELEQAPAAIGVGQG